MAGAFRQGDAAEAVSETVAPDGLVEEDPLFRDCVRCSLEGEGEDVQVAVPVDVAECEPLPEHGRGDPRGFGAARW